MTDTPDDIQRKIANLEALRSTLGDAAVDAAIAALRAQADPTEIIDGTAGVGGNNSGQNIGVNRGIVQLLIGSTVLSKDSIKPVEQGLAALGELVSNPAIRTTVAIYSAQFEQVATQILRMQAYKEIHDLLHQMHFHCYIVLNSAVKRIEDHSNFSASEGEDNLFSISIYATNLQEISTNLKSIAQKGIVSIELLTWVDQLSIICELLFTGIEQHNTANIKRALRQVKRILSIHPSRFNERLAESVQFLIDMKIGVMMEEVRGKLSGFPIEPELLATFGQGITAIADVGQQLQELVREHNAWQVIEKDVHMAEILIGVDKDALNEHWEHISDRINLLCQERNEAWVIKIRKAREQFDQALESGETSRTVKMLSNFHRAINLRFFEVDRTIKEFCSELSRLGKPLNDLQLELVKGL